MLSSKTRHVPNDLLTEAVFRPQSVRFLESSIPVRVFFHAFKHLHAAHARIASWNCGIIGLRQVNLRVGSTNTEVFMKSTIHTETVSRTA